MMILPVNFRHDYTTCGHVDASAEAIVRRDLLQYAIDSPMNDRLSFFYLENPTSIVYIICSGLILTFGAKGEDSLGHTPLAGRRQG